MFLTVLGYKAKQNSDGSILCINPKMPKERRQIVIWHDGKMNQLMLNNEAKDVLVLHGGSLSRLIEAFMGGIDV